MSQIFQSKFTSLPPKDWAVLDISLYRFAWAYFIIPLPILGFTVFTSQMSVWNSLYLRDRKGIQKKAYCDPVLAKGNLALEQGGSGRR